MVTNATDSSPNALVGFDGHSIARSIGALNLLTIGGPLLIGIAIIILIHDVLVYVLASTSSRKNLLVTPWLMQLMAKSWNDVSSRNSFARSDAEVGNILNSLAKTAKKYEGRWEKSRLL
ncbi:hypothetical protein SK128_013377, partial [Halocaridina rubra]